MFGPVQFYVITCIRLLLFMQNKKAKDDGFNIRHPTLDNILN